MTDPNTFTAEHKAWQWDLVLQFENGSLNASAWNVGTLTTVAQWYANNLSREQATARYEQHYERNKNRLLHRRDNATVQTEAITAVDAVWKDLLAKALEQKG